MAKNIESDRAPVPKRLQDEPPPPPKGQLIKKGA
jgi:hypothetical protein